MNVEPSSSLMSSFFDFLGEKRTIEPDVIQRLKIAVSKTKQPIDIVATELGLIREDTLAIALARCLQVEFIVNPASHVDNDLLSSIGKTFLQDSGIVPLQNDNETDLAICVCDPFDDHTFKLLAYATDKQIKLKISTRAAVSNAIEVNTEAELVDDAILFSTDTLRTSEDVERLQSIAHEAPIVRLFSNVVQQAVDSGATDIHIEPMDNQIQVRFRIDGLLQPFETVSLDMLSGLSTRVKILSRLNISERRLPQDGRMRMPVRGTPIDLRVSIIPSVNGETIVLRILDRSQVRLDLEALGFDLPARRSLEAIAKLPNGIVLITGPTGSGKTTTLYGLLSLINSQQFKIFTVEDPVEYPMNGVTQLQIDPAIGLTFARALRSVLRQDPDIILVGEIRDKETADIAMQAALTGHLVLATLHTNSATGAITRLRDMGVPNYLIASTVKASIGQRLLRKRCTHCTPDQSKENCKSCAGVGYRGRTVAYEIASFDHDIASAISDGINESRIAEMVCARGMVTISDHANLLQKNGVTTLQEVMRVVSLNG